MRRIIFINLFRGPLAAFSKASQWDHSKSTSARTQQEIRFAFKSEKTYIPHCLFIFSVFCFFCLCNCAFTVCFISAAFCDRTDLYFQCFLVTWHVGYEVIKVNCYNRFNNINYKIRFLYIYIQMPKNVCRNVLYATSR